MLLRSIRSGVSGIFASILLGLLFLSFVVWGIGSDVLRSHSATSVATVGGHDIPTYVFDREYRNAKERAREMLGPRATPQVLATLGLERAAVQQLVQAELLRLETESLGLLPDDKAVLADIQTDPMFQNAEGTFDKARYATYLKQRGLREAADVEDRRLRIGERLLLHTLTASAPTDGLMAKTLYAAQHEARTADIVILSPQQVAAPGAPDEKELEEFYKTHTSLFMQPELRTLSYLYVPAAALGADEDAGLSSLSAKIQDMLAGGSTMPEVAKALKLENGTVGPLDQQGNANGTPAKGLPAWHGFLDSGFALEEGNQTQLLKADAGGYFLVQADKVQTAAPMPYEQAKPKLTAAWLERERERKLFTFAQNLSKELAESKDKAATLAHYGLTASPSGELTRTSLKAANGLALPSELVKDVFARPLGQPTAAFPGADGRYVLAIPRSRIGAAAPSAAELKTFADTLADAARNEFLTAYLGYLQQKYSVTVRQDVLASYAASPAE